MGLPSAEREILSAARHALAQARHGALTAVCLGVAGADRPEVSRPLLAWARKSFPAKRHCVTSDAAIALEAALGGAPGVLVIAGTGSIACARDTGGRLLRAGGWGAAFDDAGSGFDLGRQAVRHALRALDGRGPQTRLVAALARRLGLADLREVAGRRLSPPEIAALAPVVIEASRRGDAVARGIVSEAGRELAQAALALVGRTGAGKRPISVICAGGLFRSSGALRRVFARHLRRHAPKARISVLRREPVEGALRLARSAADSGARAGWPGPRADIIIKDSRT